jgi:hypothetical protein
VAEFSARAAVAAAVAMMLSLWGHLAFYLSSNSGPEQDSRQASPPWRLVADRNWLPIVVSPVVAEAFSSRLLALVQFRRAAVQATVAMVRHRWVVTVQVRMGM